MLFFLGRGRGNIGHMLSTVTSAPDKYIFVSDDLVLSMWCSLLEQSVFS